MKTDSITQAINESFTIFKTEYPKAMNETIKITQQSYKKAFEILENHAKT